MNDEIGYMDFYCYGKWHKGCIGVGTYTQGGGLALELYTKDEDFWLSPYATLTVNLPEGDCPWNCGFIDTNNFPEATFLILRYGLGKPTGRMGCSGYCYYPEYEFNLDELEKYGFWEETE